jgi:glyoxylase I family protein
MAAPLAQRLHHTAYVTKDQAATRAFYEDVLGFPLLATWSEADELFGAVRVYCHTFFGLADEADQTLFDPDLAPSPFRHIALKVDAAGQAELERRLTDAKWKPEATFVLEHGYCRSLYTTDPNGMVVEFTADASGADKINVERRADAHATLERWLAGDHTSNNVYR